MGFVVAYIVQEKGFVGLGPSRSRQLYEEFGCGLVDALLEGSELIAKLVGRKRTFDITQIAAEHLGALRFARELDELCISHFLTVSEAMPVIRAHKAVVSGSLREDPFVLGAVLPWSKLKKIALHLGIDSSDVRFVMAAIDEEFRQMRISGSLPQHSQ
ncbi:hypothetical protein [Aliiroseovarius sp. 2305UL8-7]|uniref:hypothetical protein n=1 Tax=Aliiroseovarius conchicola TaxID=3121637 RepID=UPI0035291B3B